ncbi:alpha/beta hydrolase [Leptothoe sp. PORK10 BA2]|uniref:alpha/beta hydrolase n=1 Tax=Leptothoe sp. PORK10 BA2 TaxID=3110254 RepID=UPI002B1EB5DD|nr:alpha/beta hydrolase [Leptothoe sp. PORK10 BA2]MEA5462767.1 alpha/beta hydrolase [Leptothoe sp. PORK10 BA2]
MKRLCLSAASKDIQRLARSVGTVLGTVLGTILTTAAASQGAERVTFAFGPVERSIELADLEQLAENGVLSEDLAYYAQFLPDDYDVDVLRQALTWRLDQDIDTIDVDVVLLDRFFHTKQGEYLLNIAADFIRTEARRSDLRALRGALLVAVSDQDEGLTLLNTLRNFPSSEMRIELDRGLGLLREINRAIYETEASIDLLERLGAPTVALSEMEQARLRALALQAQRPGRFQVERQTLASNAPIPADVYLPTLQGQRQPNRPTVIISHGLGSDRTSYAYLGEHLASHGFLVLNVEHPGSNAAQINALLVGKSADVIPNEEFLERPQGISALLNYLEREATQYRNLINFAQVGIVGQSFGGYTALALAGASLDFEVLQASCPPGSLSLNASLLLQCQASQLAESPETTLSLQDGRVRAAIAINPITSVIFGEESLGQVTTPTMLVSSGADTVAPALQEQLVPFTWLTHPERYLLLMRQGTHFSTIAMTATGSESFDLPPEIIGPAPELAQTYLAASSLAFLTQHLTGNSTYGALLTADGIAQLNQDPIKLSLVQSLTGPALADQLGGPPRAAADEIISPEALTGAELANPAPVTPEVLLDETRPPAFSAPPPPSP